MLSLHYNNYYELLDILYRKKAKSIYTIEKFKKITLYQNISNKKFENWKNVQLHAFFFCYLLKMQFFSVNYKKKKEKNISLYNCYLSFFFSNKKFNYFIFEFLNNLSLLYFILNLKQKILKVNKNFLLKIDFQNFTLFNFYVKKINNSISKNIFLINYNCE